MPAPWVWIFIPLVAGFLSYLIRRFERVNLLFGMTIALSLALLAWLRPIGVRYSIGSVSFELSESLNILGRKFVIQPEQTQILVFIYLGVAFWLGGAMIARAGRLFTPAGLTIAGLATAALAVEPFLYAALLIEVAAILCVPLLSPPGRSADRGALRFLIYQTLSVPCILFTGWLLAGAEAIPADSLLVTRAALLLAIGFSLLLAIFPFHSWMPMVAESANLYVAAFVFYMFPLVASLYGLGFLGRYAWLRTSPDVYTLFLWVGVGMAILGGVGAALQQHLGRMLAMAMMLEIGLGLTALGLLGFAEERQALLNIYFASLLPRGLGLGVWGLAGEVLARRASAGEGSDRLHLSHFRGVGLALPITAGALVLAQLSFSGFPLTAGFPVRFGLWQGLSAHSQSFALLALLASFGVLLAALRTMTALASGAEQGGWQIGESRAEGLLLSIGGVALLAAGVFPQLYMLMVNAANLFANLGQ